MEPVAIIGFAFKLPQDAMDEGSLWEVLESRRNLMTAWPENRGMTESFCDEGSNKVNTLHAHGAHFLKEDPAVFDAPFFSITSKEAAAMDPQQRWVLETAYHAFENAGIPMERLRGSRTAVFGASMTDDYSRMFAKDPDTAPRMTATGIQPSCLPNRISWYFNLRGPSVLVNTACSSSLVALDHACQSIRTGDASAALVFGSNMLLSPESSLLLANMNFLSPDSLCRSFDHRANGYARGEGVVAMVVKPLSDALRDSDVIRAVIRATGTNQDGRTPGLTQPSAEAQEMLIRHVYQKAGLAFEDTRYVEAHGTGTPTGDPIEMSALGRVFRTHRSPQDPLYVGSVKANIGHLEGGSGLAGLLKTIIALEKGIIPPNALFDKMNPAIDAEFYNLQVPTENMAWPTGGLRRASVNSFGFGGSNAHAVLDDALHYLQSRGLAGYHNCIMSSSHPAMDGTTHRTDEALENKEKNAPSSGARLLIWTAADAGAIERIIRSYQSYYHARIAGRKRKLDQLACTLATRRSHMPWRSFAVVDTWHGIRHDLSDDQVPLLPTIKPIRASSEKLGIAFVFTGQGAQHVGMGLELLRYPIFAETLRCVDAVLSRLGCTWSLFDAFGDQKRVDRPKYSQPLCTALQLALVELLKSFGIVPLAVVGHSSGEIAAAYTVGALSFESACKVAYYRGQVAEKLRAKMCAAPGAMMSVNLSEIDVRGYLDKMEGMSPGSVHIACVNSPINCTLSAPEELIDKIKQQLDADAIFAQKLNTGTSYHSPAMQSIANEYLGLMGDLDVGLPQDGISMISTVTGNMVTKPELLSSAEYWVDNLVSPVLFADAVQGLAEGAALKIGMEVITSVVEIGPHAALRRSVLDTLAKVPYNVRYYTTLQRSKSPIYTILTLLGALFCHGYPVLVATGNGHGVGKSPPPLVDCPHYPFDHSRKYWAEPRMSKAYRLRPHTVGHLLGKRTHDWNALRPSFRNWLSVEALPWLGDHVISNTTICPGAGMVVMALEAVRQSESSTTSRLPISGFLLKEAHFLHPISVAEEAQAATETYLCLRPVRKSDEKKSGRSEVVIFAYHDERWTECFRADVQVQYEEEATRSQVDGGRERQLEVERVRDIQVQSMASCTKAINSVAFYDFLRTRGLEYGPAFRLLQDMYWDGQDVSAARVDTTRFLQAGGSPVHPAVLDAAVQLILAQVSKGMAGPTPTLVPQQLSNAWISAQAWACMGPSVRLTSILRENNNLAIEGSLYALADDGSPLCTIERMAMVPVSRDNDAPDENERHDQNLLYEIEWKPQLSMLSPQQLQQLCDAQSQVVAHNDTSGITKLDSAMRKVACHVVQLLSRTDVEVPGLPGHIRRFTASLKHLYGENDGSSTDWDDIQKLLEECEAESPVYHVATTIGRNLESILRGDTDALELFVAADPAVFYASVFGDMYDARFQYFLDLASHQNPGMRILEVGAGTGGMTHNILRALQAFEQRTGSARFAEYTYTDVSPAFFEAARVKFASFSDRLVFKKLDVEYDPREEGFELGAYDMVIAGSVLHATSQLSTTLTHMRAMLRPGGYLVNIEVTAPDSAWANVCFGSLSGWWLSTEPWRQHSPLVSEQDWEILTRGAGFSGLDLCFGLHAGFSLMVSTALEEEQRKAVGRSTDTDQFQCRLVLLVDLDQEGQQALASQLGENGRNIEILHLDRLQENTWAGTDVVVSLLEVGMPRLAGLGEHDFQALQALIQRAQNLLWVTGPTIENGGETEAGPQHSMSTGLMRVIRSEEPGKHIVTLAVESLGYHDLDTKMPQAIYASYIIQVLKACFDDPLPLDEVEFIVRDGHLTIGRLIHAANLDDDRQTRVQPRLRDEQWMPGPALMLEVGTPGMLDTLRFIKDAQYSQYSEVEENALKLGTEEVEIEARAWPVSFRDLFIALGRLDQEGLGFECAGIVTRVGAAAEFRPGDRVCMIMPGCMRTYPRAPAEVVFKVPDSVSFHDAVAAINPGMTAYQALINIAHLQKSDKVLIHSAAGSTGQMATWIAKRVGAEVFVTVGLDEKKQLLIDKFGIAADHIFYSRDSSFAQGIMRITKGYGVDVVLNSLSGDGLRASWECIAPYGRFVEIGKMDIGANAALPMAYFAKNVSFCAVDLYHIVQTNARLARQLVQAVMDLIAGGEVACPTPLHVYSATQIERAFRYMQSGRNTGRIIIDISHGHMVPKLLVKRSTWRLDPNASYLVAGGLGGLGRVITNWMADKGAKTLIIPSRSGISARAASDVVSELRNKGVQVVAPPCDVGSATELAALLHGCANAGLPPIKGCINAAMALQDAVFERMTHAQWERTVRSKVNTSWNLHQQLPRDMAFFILLSSMSGIYGSLAQANYAAGCTFQDALARHRTIHGTGKTSVSLDLGWMRDAGIVAEREDYRRNRRNARDMNTVAAVDLIALLDIYCDPALPPSEACGQKSQLLVGAVNPVHIRDRGELSGPFEARPLFAGFAVAAAAAGQKTIAPQRPENKEQPTVLFRRATGAKAQADVVVSALISRLARALDVAADDVDERRPLSDYGVDSLMAVELRNWIRRDFSATVAVFEMMGGGASIAAVGKLVVERAEEK